MKFKGVLILEFRRLLSPKSVLIFFGICLLLSYFLYDGTNEYISVLKEKTDFQNTENMKVKLYTTITQYGLIGIRLLPIPSPISVFFMNAGIGDMTAAIDTSDKLLIFNNLKGKTIFRDSSEMMDFSGVLFLLSGVISLIFGYKAFQNLQYIKFLTSIKSLRWIFLSIAISRMIIITICLLIIAVISITVIFLKFNYIHPFIILFYLILLLIFFFFFSVGIFIRTVKNESYHTLLTILIYFVSIFLLPQIVNKISYYQTKKTIRSLYKIEEENIKTIMAFERDLFQKFGPSTQKQTITKEIKEAIAGLINNQYKDFEKKEIDLRNTLINRVKEFHLLSSMFPTTFLKATSLEISTKGYFNLINFYNYVQQEKKGFINFYVNQKFYSKNVKIQKYNGQGNCFFMSPGLPNYWFLGVFTAFIYTCILLLMSYGRIHSLIYSKELNNKFLYSAKLIPGRVTYFYTYIAEIKDHIYSVFSKRISDKNISIIGDIKVKEFLFIPDTSSFPKDIKAKDLYKLLSQKRIDDPSIFSVIQKYALESSRLVLFDEFMKDRSDFEWIQFCKKIKENKLLSIYIGHDGIQFLKSDEKVITCDETLGETLAFNDLKN